MNNLNKRKNRRTSTQIFIDFAKWIDNNFQKQKMVKDNNEEEEKKDQSSVLSGITDEEAKEVEIRAMIKLDEIYQKIKEEKEKEEEKDCLNYCCII